MGGHRINCRRGLRHRCYRRDSEYHLANECPWRDAPRGDRSPPPQGRGKARKPYFPAISTNTPVLAQEAGRLDSEETKSEREQFLSPTSGARGSLLAPDEDSVVLETGATANFVCFRQLERHNRPLEKKGCQKVSTYPPSARFRFGRGRLGEERHAAETPEGIAGHKCKFTALLLDAGILAFLRKGLLEALGGQLGFSRDVSVLRKHGVAIPLLANRMGHYILSVADFS